MGEEGMTDFALENPRPEEEEEVIIIGSKVPHKRR
jgi:hypothetical protein